MGERFKEILCTVLLILFVVCLVNASAASTKTAQEVFEKVKEIVDIRDLKRCDEIDFKEEFGLTASDYQQIVYYSCESVMDVREILVIKLNNESQYDSLSESIKKRTDEKAKLFEGYAPQQGALLKKYVLSKKADLVFFAVCENSDEAVDAFRKAV